MRKFYRSILGRVVLSKIETCRLEVCTILHEETVAIKAQKEYQSIGSTLSP
jgi:hypothetical protein